MQEIKILNIRSEKLINKGTWLILKIAVFNMSMNKWMLYQKSVKFKKNKAELTTEKILIRKFWSIRLRLFLWLKKEETIKDKKELIKKQNSNLEVINFLYIKDSIKTTSWDWFLNFWNNVGTK